MSESGPLDLSGRWDGTFAYPSGVGPVTPFLAEIIEQGGTLSGSILEPELAHGSGEAISAVLSGHRAGTAVDFTKTYRGQRLGYENPVDYVGTLSADGLRIAGVWSLLHLDGTFEMHRDARQAAMEEREGEETITAPTASP